MRFFSFLFLVVGFIAFGQTYYTGGVYGGAGMDFPYKSAKDSNGNVYTAGSYQGSINFGANVINAVGGSADAYLTKHDANGNPVWVKSFQGVPANVAMDVAVDSNNNIYLVGYFQGSGSNSFDANPANIDDDGIFSTPNADEYWLSQPALVQSRDGFIIKLDSNGAFVWARQISNPTGAGANEDITAIEVDSNGDLYMVGNYILADFDPDPNVSNILTADNGSANNADGFILKITSSGAFAWVKTLIGTGGITRPNDLALDASNNLYITGQFIGSIDLDPDATATANFTSNGNYDVFLAKYDANGNYLWGNTFGSSAVDIPNVVKVLSSGVYVGGYISGVTDFDPSSGVNSITPNGSVDGFVSKFSTSGAYQFTNTYGGATTSIDQVNDIEEMNSNILITGDFLGTADFDTGAGVASATANGTDIFMVKISSTGNYMQHLVYGDLGTEDNGKLKILNGNKIMVYGAFQSSAIDVNPFSGVDAFSNVAQRDVFWSVISESFLATNDITKTPKNFGIYPNPATDFVTIKTNEKVTKYEIFSMEGRIVGKGEVVNNTVNVAQLQTGNYIMNIKVGDSWISHKLIKK